jgi:hypothetical protein
VPSNSELKRLIQGLIAASRSGRVPWGKASDGDAYIFAGTKAGVVVGSVDDDGRSPYFIRVFDNQGALVEEANTGLPDIDMNLAAAVSELYSLARDLGRNLTPLVNSILQDIGEEEPF